MLNKKKVLVSTCFANTARTQSDPLTRVLPLAITDHPFMVAVCTPFFILESRTTQTQPFHGKKPSCLFD